MKFPSLLPLVIVVAAATCCCTVVAEARLMAAANSNNNHDDYGINPVKLVKLDATLPDDARIVADAYVVKLRGDPEVAANEVFNIILALGHTNESVEYEYAKALQGMTLSNVTKQTMYRLLESNSVVSITPDYYFDLDGIQHRPESWGLDRIDEETLPMDGQYHFEHSGAGVDVYLLDTGIYREHSEFTTETDMNLVRSVRCGYNAFAESLDTFDFDCTDDNGHGTHTAAILGGTQHGVSKHVNLISVKVHDEVKGSTLSSILAGLDYVMWQKEQSPEQPMVVNISLGGPKSELVNGVVESIVQAGIVVVVSAGNEDDSSCNKSPASSNAAITVSATDYQDAKPFYANYGLCTNIFAPGHQITSAWIRNDRDIAILSGTSFAAPHVAGVAAQYLEKYPSWTPNEVWAALEAHAMRGLVTEIPGTSTSNLLLNTGDLRSPF